MKNATTGFVEKSEALEGLATSSGMERIARAVWNGVAEHRIASDVEDALLLAKKMEELACRFCEHYFGFEDEDDGKCLMAGVLFDYANQIKEHLQELNEKPA
ncbi:TPA: hypothetical protein PL572_004472 [Cronobacter turicensis]|nr:hypothetical protein [Cronobacter turicensis]